MLLKRLKKSIKILKKASLGNGNKMTNSQFEKKSYQYTRELWQKEILMYQKRAKKLYDTDIKGSNTSSGVNIKRKKDKSLPPMAFIKQFSKSLSKDQNEEIAKKVGYISADLSDISQNMLNFSDQILKLLDTKPENNYKIAGILVDIDTLMSEMHFHSMNYISNIQRLLDILYGDK